MRDRWKRFLEILGKVTTDSDFFCWIFFGAKIFSNKKSLNLWSLFQEFLKIELCISDQSRGILDEPHDLPQKKKKRKETV